MFGTRRTEAHSGEIPLRPTFPNLPDDAFELARFWVNSERSFVAVGRPQQWDPELLGSLLVESVHTAAVAYAEQNGMPQDEALSRIWRGFDEERERLANGD
jgi:hypothetical protein